MKNLARKRLAQIGFPNKKNENWIYFPVSKIPALETLEFENSLTEDTLGILQETNAAALWPIAFNAYSKVHHIEKNPTLIPTSFLKFRDEFSHSILHLHENAEFQLEIFGNNSERNFSCDRIDMTLEKNAKVFIFFHEDSALGKVHLSHFRFQLEENAQLIFCSLFANEGVSRASFDILLNGENSSVDYRSFAYLEKEAQVHTNLKIFHNAKETKSSQFVRHLLKNNSYASYDGEVTAKKNCSLVNSSQLINTILDDDAKISVKPNLKIYHDNVECSHGNTCGSFDSEELFYLQSRGLSEKKAKNILTKSFAHETFVFTDDFSDSVMLPKRIATELKNLGF